MSEMQYFVSIENNAYSRWQAELLIESFKYHNREDQLLVAIADNNGPDLPHYTKNLLAHQQKFVYTNFGKEFKPFNKTRSLLWALEQKLLRKPFVLLHPDMLLLNPLELRPESVVYDLNDTYLPLIKFYLAKRVARLLQESSFDWFSWIPLGDTLVFNRDVPDEFFTLAHLELEYLVRKFGPRTDLKLEKMAWMMTIYKEITFKEGGHLTITGAGLEQNFSAHNVHRNIIHYKDGILPEFNKHNYRYEPPMFMALHSLEPFDCIYENNMTSSTHFAYELIERYRN